MRQKNKEKDLVVINPKGLKVTVAAEWAKDQDIFNKGFKKIKPKAKGKTKKK